MAIKKKNNPNYKKLLPQNIFAEEVLLGYLLLTEVTAHNIITIIKSDFFSLEKHQILYLNIINIYNQYNYMSITHLIYLLWYQNILSKIGGLKQITYLIKKTQVLLSFSENNTQITEYINIVYNHYIRRIFIQYSYDILQLSYIKNISTNTLYNKSTYYLQEISKLIQLQSSENLQELINNFLLEIHQEKNQKIQQSISSGFKALDKLTNGFKYGDLIVIAGRPSMGKTSFAINITSHIILQLHLGVYFFSLEMSKNQILDKIISAISKIAINSIRNKYITKYQWEKLHQTCQLLMKSNLYIDDTGHASINYIRNKTKAIYSIDKKKSYYRRLSSINPTT